MLVNREPCPDGGQPCVVQQKQPGVSALRLKAVGGNLTTAQLRTIADVADKYGSGEVHLSTRQGIEIHHIADQDLQAATAELAAGGVCMGAGGATVRIVVACPGDATCRYGAIETRHLAAELDRRYYGRKMPHKFKIAVAGCPNNCGKAREADLGIMGATVPEWDAEACTLCEVCVPACPVDAIRREGDRYVLDRERCILCSVCVVRCPEGAWKPAQRGATMLIGGTMGKLPRLGVPLKQCISDEQELFQRIDDLVDYYRTHGQPKERLGHMMERMGEERVIQEILESSPRHESATPDA
jgi:dissimilatory sulfite reductase (desulfoviridin) alpha/beta subunit